MKTGVIHGRFQGLHNGHMEYLLTAKKRCDFLVIGITNFLGNAVDSEISRIDDHRLSEEGNPFSFYERLEMISGALIEAGVPREEFTVVPFPIENPEQIKNFVPGNAVYFMTIYDEWGKEKKKRLEELGLSVEVMWERTEAQKPISGSLVRERIKSGKEWKNLVPPFVYNYITGNKFISLKPIQISKEDFGGKAYWLNWLKENQFNIPRSVYVKARAFENVIFSEAMNEIEKLLEENFEGIEKVAVRSSALCEDGEEQSCAGLYETAVNISNNVKDVFAGYLSVLKSGKTSGEKIGAVIQEMINPSIFGVMFTSNPMNFSKEECVIEYVEGLGENLVSGKKNAQRIIVRKDKPVASEKINLNELLQTAIKIEKMCKRPMDIEWCIEKNTGKLFILQCRPVTNVFFNSNKIRKVNFENMEGDNNFSGYEKITMRFSAQKNNLRVSDAYVVSCNCVSEKFPFSRQAFSFTRSRNCRGYNIVVLEPKLTGNKVIRSFVGEKEKVHECISCNRYGIRSFPEHDNLFDSAKSFYDAVCKTSWRCIMIIQEIYDPEFTGILKKINEDEDCLEITYGHFASKGVVPMSSYKVKGQEVVFKNEVYQEKKYRLIEGHKIEQIVDKVISVSESVVSKTVGYFKSLLNDGMCVEFGLLKNDDDYIPYLIDFTEETDKKEISSQDISSGVISAGKVKGVLRKISQEEMKNSMDLHFKDQIETETEGESIIYYCDLPDISLNKKLVPGKTGFVFNSGSMLCHLAVLLREKGIPAIVGADEYLLDEGIEYTLDTSKKGTWEDRIYHD